MSSEWISAATSLGATVIATIALIFAARPVRLASRQRGDQLNVARHARAYVFGQFLLQLDEAFRVHQRVHRRLRPRHGGSLGEMSDVGTWRNPGAPITPDDWADVEAYLGLFERIAVLVDRNLLDAEVVVRLYGYRITNIWTNDVIRQKKLVE